MAGGEGPPREVGANEDDPDCKRGGGAKQQFFSRGQDVGKSIRTEWSVEIDDVFVVKRLGRSVEGRCPGCGQVATLITPEDAMMLTGMETRAVYRLIEAGEIHWADGPENLLLVCLDSLLEKAGQMFPSE